MTDIKSAILNSYLAARDLSEDSLKEFQFLEAERKIFQVQKEIEYYRKAKRESNNG